MSAPVKGRAGFSRCGRYRYWLRREWDDTLPQCAFIGLNPSTADAETDDPTLRRCIGFARRWGYGSLLLVNLFGLRATDPATLSKVSDPVGPGTNRWLRRAGTESQLVVAAWGNGGQLFERAKNVAHLIEHAQCLGLTVQGMPRHPLYCPKHARLIPYQPPGYPHDAQRLAAC
ncbi:MAG: DUF1643 domain-containing protein [Luminiphilus sp.]|nr:DUF1643 domain-containing protein [Luminiphilus sp.]